MPIKTRIPVRSSPSKNHPSLSVFTVSLAKIIDMEAVFYETSFSNDFPALHTKFAPSKPGVLAKASHGRSTNRKLVCRTKTSGSETDMSCGRNFIKKADDRAASCSYDRIRNEYSNIQIYPWMIIKRRPALSKKCNRSGERQGTVWFNFNHWTIKFLWQCRSKRDVNYDPISWEMLLSMFYVYCVAGSGATVRHRPPILDLDLDIRVLLIEIRGFTFGSVSSVLFLT